MGSTNMASTSRMGVCVPRPAPRGGADGHRMVRLPREPIRPLIRTMMPPRPPVRRCVAKRTLAKTIDVGWWLALGGDWRGLGETMLEHDFSDGAYVNGHATVRGTPSRRPGEPVLVDDNYRAAVGRWSNSTRSLTRSGNQEAAVVVPKGLTAAEAAGLSVLGSLAGNRNRHEAGCHPDRHASSQCGNLRQQEVDPGAGSGQLSPCVREAASASGSRARKTST